MKVYHLPDWSRAVKGSGTTLTDYALCGENVTSSGQWFAINITIVNCKKCLSIFNMEE